MSETSFTSSPWKARTRSWIGRRPGKDPASPVACFPLWQLSEWAQIVQSLCLTFPLAFPRSSFSLSFLLPLSLPLWAHRGEQTAAARWDLPVLPQASGAALGQSGALGTSGPAAPQQHPAGNQQSRSPVMALPAVSWLPGQVTYLASTSRPVNHSLWIAARPQSS